MEKIYKEISEEEIEKELECFKKPILYTCNRENQHFCIYYEGKYCVRCIPLEKGIVRLESNLIATIIPRITMISIVSKYIKSVEPDMEFPPKIILNLKER